MLQHRGMENSEIDLCLQVPLTTGTAIAVHIDSHTVNRLTRNLLYTATAIINAILSRDLAYLFLQNSYSMLFLLLIFVRNDSLLLQFILLAI